MSTNVDEWGPNLYAYLEAYWRANGTNANAWSGAHVGIEAPTLSRWRGGSVPSLTTMRTVADALGLSMLDILLIAGIVDASEATGQPPTPPVLSVDAAIKSDPDLTPFQRKTLADILDALRRVESGEVDRVEQTSRRATRK